MHNTILRGRNQKFLSDLEILETFQNHKQRLEVWGAKIVTLCHIIIFESRYVVIINADFNFSLCRQNERKLYQDLFQLMPLRYEFWRLSVWIVKLDDSMNYDWPLQWGKIPIFPLKIIFGICEDYVRDICHSKAHFT